MKILKIAEVRSQGFSPFIQFLKFLTEQKGWGWEFELCPEYSMDLLERVDAVSVDPLLSSLILPQISVASALVKSVGCLDSFFKEGRTWYPRLLIHEAIRLVLVEQARDLDTRSPAFVIGDGELSRIVSSVLVEMGIRDLYLVGDLGFLEHQKEILMRSHFGSRFHLLPPEELTLQSVSSGILVNTVDLSEQKNLLTDLSYFNYMKSSGFVLDLNVFPVENNLLEEAEREDLRVLSPVLCLRQLVPLWMKQLEVPLQISDDEVCELWEQFLKIVPT